MKLYNLYNQNIDELSTVEDLLIETPATKPEKLNQEFIGIANHIDSILQHSNLEHLGQNNIGNMKSHA